MNRLHVLSSDPDHCLARFDGVQIQLWRSRVPLTAARLAKEKAQELPKGSERALFVVVEAGAKPPEGEARRILTVLGTKLEGALGCAFVSEGEGFGAAAMRGIMTSMSLLVRPRFPVKVFARVEQGAAWLTSVAPSYRPEHLVEAVAQMRGEGV